MLRVGLDVSPLALTKAGTARYITNLLAGLEHEPSLEIRRYSFGGAGRLTKVARDLAWYPAALPRAAKRDRLDVLHCATIRAPLHARLPLVVSVHDVAVLRHPETFNRWTRSYSALTLPRVARAASAIVVGSTFSRDEVVTLLDVPETKVRVIPYGVGPPFSADGPAAEGDYVLAVSTVEPRKNLARLVEGFRRADLDGLELRIVGAEGWGDVGLNGERVRRMTGVDDEELARLYRGAAARRLRLSLRGLRASRAGGDGLRRARRRPGRAALQRVRPRRRVRGRPARPRFDRTGPSASDRRRRAARRRAPGGRLHLGAGGSGACRPLPGARRMKPLVAIDADVLGRHRTGDETYMANLLRELAPLADRERLAAVTRRPDLVPAGIEAVELPARSQVARMAVGLPRTLRRLRPALGHFNYVIPPAFRGPAVLTVHDLSFERHPGLMSPRDLLLFRTFVPRSARRAGRVLAVSERTKRDLVERYGIAEGKVVVTPNGVDPIFRPDGGAPERPPYALFVGGIQPRKDPVSAIEALGRLNGDLGLVLVGAEKRGGRRVRRVIRSLGLEQRVELTGYLKREELAGLYRGAACLVFPSRYEGFGLPVLEAMASGTPVVASNAGALPEVAGNAAILVEPGDPVALADGIERALADRERLVQLGLERARGFSWTETARQTLAVYRELL